MQRSLWTRDSNILLGAFFITVFLIVYIWWPLAEEYLAYIDWNGPWWRYMDWLLLGIFTFMSITIITRANLKTDALIVFVGICGGLAIESWGTQTNLWHYYTAERPPLWIIPAWPIASLSIDRITRRLDFLTTKAQSLKDPKIKNFVSWCLSDFVFKILYSLTFASFLTLMLVFVSPTLDKSYTILSFSFAFSSSSHQRTTVLHFLLLSQVLASATFLSYGALPASAGYITPTKHRRCLRCSPTAWPRSLFGELD